LITEGKLQTGVAGSGSIQVAQEYRAAFFLQQYYQGVFFKKQYNS